MKGSSIQRLLVGNAITVLLLAGTAIAQAAPVAHKANNNDTLRLFLAGPSLFLIFVASLAVVVLIAAGLGGLEKLAGLGTRAARRLDLGFVAPTLWGICVSLLIFALMAVLAATKILGPLAAVVAIIAFCLSGLGAAVAATVYGRGIAMAIGSVELDDLTSMRLGLWTLLLASSIPFIGWLVVLLAIAGGLGAVFQSLSAKGE